MRILVTGAAGASGIATIKMLQRTTPHEVLSAHRDPAATGLKMTEHGFVIPPPFPEKRFIKKLNELIHRFEIDLIIPNVDDELGIFSSHIDEFATNVLVSAPQSIAICEDKMLTLRHLTGKVPTPKIFQTGNMEYPLFLKPRIARGSAHTYLVKNRTSHEGLLKYLKDTAGLTSENMIALEYLLGTEYSVDIMCGKKGELIVAIPRKRIRTEGGISMIGEVVKNGDIEKEVHEICKNIPFIGPVNIQFKEDEEGVPRIIEINPRFSGGLTISMAAGVNLVDLAVKVAFERPIQRYETEWEECTVYRYLEEVIIK